MDTPAFKDALETVLQRAREDAAFFHKLVFNPDSIISELPDNRELKAAIYGIDPRQLLSSPPGRRHDVRMCSETCGPQSCQGTCGEASCDHTCLSSCHDTCASLSCGFTTHVA
jgi:hypothetical protein